MKIPMFRKALEIRGHVELRIENLVANTEHTVF